MKFDTRKFTVLAILIAVTIVLQSLATLFPINVAGLTFSFSLIPLVIASCFFGISGGAIVGGTFGLVIFVLGLMGLEPSASYLITQVNPFFTFLGTAGRGLLAGTLIGAVYKAVSGKINKRASYYVTAVVTPVFNTLIFVILFALLFNPTLREWAGEQNVFSYTIVTLVGLNFIVEVVTTVLLAPPVCMALEKVIKKK